MRQWFAEFTERTGETPTKIVFGTMERWNESWAELPTAGVVVRFDSISSVVLDRTFDDGYGGTETPDICAWSKSWVIFSTNYDGSEYLEWVPRNPTDHRPVRPGGG